MEKKNKIAVILLGLGVVCLIGSFVMFSSAGWIIRANAWIPLVVGVSAAIIGIVQWLKE